MLILDQFGLLSHNEYDYIDRGGPDPRSAPGPDHGELVWSIPGLRWRAWLKDWIGSGSLHWEHLLVLFGEQSSALDSSLINGPVLLAVAE